MIAKKRWYVLGTVMLLFLLLLYLFLIRPAQKEFNLSHSELVNKTKALRRFFTRPEGLPTKEEVGFIDDEIKILEKKYIDIKKALIHEAMEEVNITPVKFAKILYETKKKLLREAEKAGLEIPPGLGFKETIPTEEEVADMVKELRVVTFVIREGIAFGFGDIKKISYPGVKVEDPWEKVGIELEVNGELGSIVGFLYNLAQREKIYIIKSMEITKGVEKIMPVAPRPRLKAAALRRRAFVEKEPVDKVVTEDRVSAMVCLEAYNYIAAHGN